MEERKSWLPAGLESSGWEPDDRASQRGAAGSKRSGGSADAASSWRPRAKESSGEGQGASSNPWQPYDPERPESKRSRKPDGSESANAGQDDRRQPGQTESKAKQRDEPEAKREEKSSGDEGTNRKEDDDRKVDQRADGDRDGQQGGRSDADAMGQDKHRRVVGQRYGASRAKQLFYYGTFVAFVVAAYFGLKVAVDNLDKAPAHDKNQAPWSKPGAPDGPLGGFTPKTESEKGPTNFQ